MAMLDERMLNLSYRIQDAIVESKMSRLLKLIEIDNNNSNLSLFTEEEKKVILRDMKENLCKDMGYVKRKF